MTTHTCHGSCLARKRTANECCSLPSFINGESAVARGGTQKSTSFLSPFFGGDSKFYVIVISQVPMAVFLTFQYEAPFTLPLQQVQCFLSWFSFKSSAVLHYGRWFTIRNTHRDELCPKNEITIAPIRATQKRAFLFFPLFPPFFLFPSQGRNWRGESREERDRPPHAAAAQAAAAQAAAAAAAALRRSSDRRSGGRRRGQCPYEDCDFFIVE